MSRHPAPTLRTADGDVDVAGELELLKALGDDTRYAIYLELSGSPQPLTTAEVASALQLHPNTVRPHLERLREVGVLQMATGTRGAVGRPQHRYELSPAAPGLGLEPSPWPTLARVLLNAASSGGLDAGDLRAAGAAQGSDAARNSAHDGSTNNGSANNGSAALRTMAALTAEQTRMGFEPEVSNDGDATTVVFANCPFRDLAESQPELVCGLHCGMVEGFVGELGGQRVTGFHPLADRTPCRVELVST
jgi:predicted ArsR family transcriptional regulator